MTSLLLWQRHIQRYTSSWGSSNALPLSPFHQLPRSSLCDSARLCHLYSSLRRGRPRSLFPRPASRRFLPFSDGQLHQAPAGPQVRPAYILYHFPDAFYQLVANSDRFIGNYSAQQAALDHRGQAEFVRIIVEIKLTPTYGAFLAPEPSSRSSSQSIPIPRPHDFWRDFQV